MVTFVVPFRRGGKTRLGGDDERLPRAMLDDVLAACRPLGPTIVADAPGGQGQAVLRALAGVAGPVAIVNADVPCATTVEITALVDAAPALVAAHDGTTNALALLDAGDFVPLYGPQSAMRFGLRPLDLAGLADDVDTLEDLERVADRLGPHTRAVLRVPA